MIDEYLKFLSQATILSIDNDSYSLQLIAAHLEGFCKRLILHNDAKTAVALADQEQPDIILLNVLMGNIDGYEVCRCLKANKPTQTIPVIFISSLSDIPSKVLGFKVGGMDYITKPFQIEEVMVRIENCLRLHQQIYHRMTVAQQSENKPQNYHLTPCEEKILSLYALGYQRKEISRKLYITDNTVKTHLKNLFMKLVVKNRTEAITKAREIGLIC